MARRKTKKTSRKTSRKPARRGHSKPAKTIKTQLTGVVKSLQTIIKEV